MLPFHFTRDATFEQAPRNIIFEGYHTHHAYASMAETEGGASGPLFTGVAIAIIPSDQIDAGVAAQVGGIAYAQYVQRRRLTVIRS